MNTNDIEQEDSIPKKKISFKKYIIIICFLIVLVITGFLFVTLGQFESYNTEETLKLENSQRTQYCSLSTGLLSYNLDGAFFMNFSGDLIWNISYEMQDPRIEKKGSCAIIYDKEGTLIKIVSADGSEGTISTTLPITSADVSDKKTVAVVMQKGSKSLLQLYSHEGKLLATGEVHLMDSGYPVDLALSSDGRTLAVSSVHLLEGNVKSEITFYGFSNSDKSKDGNKITTFSYSDVVIPQIEYLDTNKFLAFGNNQIMVFSNQVVPNIDSTIFISEEIKSVFNSNKYLGVIVSEANDSGEVSNCIKIYNLQGKQKSNIYFNHPYSYCEMMDNNELFITDGKEVDIYTTAGIKKFTYQFSEEIHKLIPGKNFRDYYIIENQNMSKIRLQ